MARTSKAYNLRPRKAPKSSRPRRKAAQSATAAALQEATNRRTRKMAQDSARSGRGPARASHVAPRQAPRRNRTQAAPIAAPIRDATPEPAPIGSPSRPPLHPRIRAALEECDRAEAPYFAALGKRMIAQMGVYYWSRPPIWTADSARQNEKAVQKHHRAINKVRKIEAEMERAELNYHRVAERFRPKKD